MKTSEVKKNLKCFVHRMALKRHKYLANIFQIGQRCGRMNYRFLPTLPNQMFLRSLIRHINVGTSTKSENKDRYYKLRSRHYIQQKKECLLTIKITRMLTLYFTPGIFHNVKREKN